MFEKFYNAKKNWHKFLQSALHGVILRVSQRARNRVFEVKQK